MLVGGYRSRRLGAAVVHSARSLLVIQFPVSASPPPRHGPHARRGLALPSSTVPAAQIADPCSSFPDCAAPLGAGHRETAAAFPPVLKAH